MKNISWKEWTLGDWGQWNSISELRDEVKELKKWQNSSNMKDGIVTREPAVEALYKNEPKNSFALSGDSQTFLLLSALIRYLVHKKVIDPKEFGELISELEK